VTPPDNPHPSGLVGLGTYDTRVEYKDFSVTGPDGKNLSNGSLIHDGQKWKFAHGRWATEDGVFRPIGEVPQTWALTGDPTWTDYTLTVRARKTSGPEGFLLLWHTANSDNYRWWNIGGWANTVSRFESSTNGGREPYGPSTPFTVEAGRWYDLKLEVSGRHARGFIDGKLVLEATDEPARPSPSAYATASYINASGEIVVKVVNSVATPLEAELQISGASTVENGKAIVISGEPDAVNSVETPTKIAPKEEVLANASADFTHTFPPYSVTVLRFPAKK
jgi:alpha-L-arabinofuranosidase